MPLYQVGVVRSYVVTIDAEDQEKAQDLAAFFLGSRDASSVEEKALLNFKIQNIELAENNSFLL